MPWAIDEIRDTSLCDYEWRANASNQGPVLARSLEATAGLVRVSGLSVEWGVAAGTVEQLADSERTLEVSRTADHPGPLGDPAAEGHHTFVVLPFF